jgi:hypothetical protein
MTSCNGHVTEWEKSSNFHQKVHFWGVSYVTELTNLN